MTDKEQNKQNKVLLILVRVKKTSLLWSHCQTLLSRKITWYISDFFPYFVWPVLQVSNLCLLKIKESKLHFATIPWTLKRQPIGEFLTKPRYFWKVKENVYVHESMSFASTLLSYLLSDIFFLSFQRLLNTYPAQSMYKYLLFQKFIVELKISLCYQIGISCYNFLFCTNGYFKENLACFWA